MCAQDRVFVTQYVLIKSLIFVNLPSCCDRSRLSCPSAFPQGQCEQQAPSLFCRNLKLPQTYFLLEGNWPTDICSEEYGGAAGGLWRLQVMGGLDGDTGHLCPVRAAAPPA